LERDTILSFGSEFYCVQNGIIKETMELEEETPIWINYRLKGGSSGFAPCNWNTGNLYLPLRHPEGKVLN
jgi:hypothetical protein